FNYDSLRIGTVDNPAGLAPGESYTASFQYQLPLKGSGEYFIKILADGEAQVHELEDENNQNSYTGGSVQVQQMPLADLEVVSFNAPEQAFSGTRLDFSYTVKNTGSAATSNDFRY